MAGEDNNNNNKAAHETSKKFQKSYFDVLGICCSSEVPLIENILKPLDGVKEVSVIIATRTVIVVHDTLLISQTQIAKALNEARLEANVRVYGEDNFKKKWPSPYSIACGVFLLLSLLKFVFRPLGWLALGAVAIGILPIFLKAVAAIRNLRLDVTILAIVAVIGTVAMRDYLEAGTIVFLFTVAEWLESRAGHKASAVMSSLLSMVPQKAVVAETGEVVDADEVKLNTVLAVKAGEVIPIDGVVVEGNCDVDEKTLTGESFPVAKQKDSTVWAGTINLNGYISVKTTALAEDCAVAKMAKLVEEAQNSKSKTQRFIDKCAKFYTPAVLIISIFVAVIPAVLRLHNLNKWFHLALVVLVSACPCGLILSTPVATFCALTKAATSGLLIKGGDHLETLAKIKLVAFDKTGTITRGEFVVSDFRSLRDDISLETLVYWVSSIESKSSHPMAAALVDYGKSLSIEPMPDSVEEFQNFPGEGIYGRVDGKDVYIGNKKIATRASCERVPTLEGFAKEGKSVGYVYCGGTAAGIFTLSDTCRSGVADAIKELMSLGIRTAMLTGDSVAAAMHTNEQLEHAIEEVRAELLPEDKAKIISEFKMEGPTAMIGDGVNDAPALATADIGISMGVSGSALATETGDVILLSNDMRKIPKAIQLARKATGKVIQNVVLSIVTKGAILALAIAGHPLVWAAVLADVGTCLLVILNSMLLLHERHNHGGKCCKSSSAPHVHKHGCNDGHNKFSPHKDHQGCSNNKAPKACKSQNCSSSETRVSNCYRRPISSSSCCDNKRRNSAESHETEHCHDHGSCDRTVNRDLESQNTHDHGFCASRTLKSSCVEDNHRALNATGRRCSSAEGEHADHHGSKHCSHSVSPSADSGKSSCCGKIKSHNDSEAHRKTDEQCSVQRHHEEDHYHEEDHSCSNKHKKNHTDDDVIQDEIHVESEAKLACMMSLRCCENHDDSAGSATSVNSCNVSFEKREMGGCCKSYLKECCSKHGHLGVALGGSLSEVVID